MRILFVSPEIDPFAKTGGLGDMVGALPKYVAALGHDARTFCPLHGSISRARGTWRPHDAPLPVFLGPGTEYGRIWETTLPGSAVPAYFLEHADHFGRHEVYAGPWGSHADNHLRFTFMQRAALDFCATSGWIPDVIHCHDWTTGLIPVMLNTRDRSDLLRGIATVFTVHNIAHQGHSPAGTLRYAGIPESEFRPDSCESYGAVNLMKAGLYHATKISAVSPTYALEIHGSTLGAGLDHVVQARSADVVGIINGIDDAVWDPETDPLLPARYSATNLAGKAVCKAHLQQRFGLVETAAVPLFGVVARFASQKGLDVLADCADAFLASRRAQLVVLGSGDPELEGRFARLTARHPGRCGAYLGFNNELAHLIEAGADFFIMPSRFEPCGLNQLYSMRYGTPPIVRATGGLLDTVEQYREGTGTGTGFIFEQLTPKALYHTLSWAGATWHDRPQDYRALQLAGMSRDWSWRVSAQGYVELYTWARETRRRGYGLPV